MLVEDAPGIGRRRVLRPWGLRRSAPLTTSPDLSENARSTHPPGIDWSVRLDLVLAGSVVVAILAATALFPRSMASDATLVASMPATTEPVTIVVTPPLQTTSVASPALVELATPVRTTPKETPRTARAEKTRAAATAAPIVAAASFAEPSSVEAPAAPAPASAPPAPVDRWDGLRDALAVCRWQGNVLERAMCEQGARIRHCTGHWDLVDLCPSGRPTLAQ